MAASGCVSVLPLWLSTTDGWSQILDTLRTGIYLKEAETDAFQSLNLLDQAGVLEQLDVDQYGSREAFGQAREDAFDLPRYELAPALLATLPSAGAITLNYDRLFEIVAFSRAAAKARLGREAGHAPHVRCAAARRRPR